MIKRTTPQVIARVLRCNGFAPSSTESVARWAGLRCARSGDEVRVRVWSNVEDVEPSSEDRADAAEIAALLVAKGYEVRYETGDYCMYVAGKKE